MSTCLTVVDNSYIVGHQERTPVVGRNESYRHRGQPCTGKEKLVDNTLRVDCHYRIVLQFMGIVEESLMMGQFRTRVRYAGCIVGVDIGMGEQLSGHWGDKLSGHSGVVLIVDRILECS